MQENCYGHRSRTQNKNSPGKRKNSEKGNAKKMGKNQTNNVCPVCAAQFSNKNLLIHHLVLHIVPSELNETKESIKSEDRLVTPIPYELNDTTVANNKSEVKNATRQFICDSCDVKFTKKKELSTHLKSAHSDLFKRRNSKPNSVRRVRRKNIQQDYEKILIDDGKKESIESFKRFKEISECPHCKTPFSMKKNLLKHMKVIHKITDHEVTVYEEHKPKIGHRCAECEKIFSLRKNLYQHLRKIHGRTDVGRKSVTLNESIRLICDACGVGFGEKKSLTRHLRMKHAVKVGREKKTVAVCVHCNSTFAHKKSLYKHERKFHGAAYKKIIKESSKSDSVRKLKESSEKPGKIDNYECLKEILPERSDYKLTQFAWLKNDTHVNWFKAKLYFFCDTKDDVKRWKENYEMLNKLCLRVLSFPRPRTPGVLYKGRFRCHHNTMPKKGAKPNAKHTACSAVLSITLLQPPPQKDSSSPSSMKAFVFLKNTHNHALGDPATLKYRKPIREVKDKFLKLFEAKKTVPQALAIHKADLEAEYGLDRIQTIVSDRAFMPDARWAYGLYYSSFKKKRDENVRSDAVSPETTPPHSIDYGPTAPSLPAPAAVPVQPQDPYKLLSDMFRSVCREIIDRCDASPGYFYSGLQTFVSAYENSCNSDAQLLTSLQSFGKYHPTTANCRTRSTFQSRNMLSLENVQFNNENMSMTTPLHPFAKYNNIAGNPKPRIIPMKNNVMQPTALANERDLLTTTQPLGVPDSHNGLEARTLYTLETNKYDDSIMYQIDNRQNAATSCWIPTEYSMF